MQTLPARRVRPLRLRDLKAELSRHAHWELCLLTSRGESLTLLEASRLTFSNYTRNGRIEDTRKGRLTTLS